MNYQKKRKRQNGRQLKKIPDITYNVWLDQLGNLYTDIDKDGMAIPLCQINFTKDSYGLLNSGTT